jgi:hypothetical protein
VFAVAVATAMLLHYARKFYATLTTTGAAQGWSVLVWVCSMLCIVSIAMAIGLSGSSKHVRATWPLIEGAALPLVIVYLRVVEESGWEGWPLSRYVLELFYAVSAVAFMSACAKVVRAVYQRHWFKAACGMIVILFAATWTLAASAMILWFV